LKKKPRFFCDHCSQEVSSDIKACPNCGRFFASVRCPACNQTGPDSMFQNGCPLCGYSAPPAKHQNEKNPSPVQVPLRSVPVWTYIIPIAVLFAIIALLSYLITK